VPTRHRRARFPNGVFNVVCGNAPAIGRVLTNHPDVRTISSQATGRKLYLRAWKCTKHVTLDLGGNSPFIIFDDADVEQAVAELVWLKQANSG
jgi:succinate-semialdehyde dehydrogenase/glutarate-semialdehyde dehydrogenase